MSDLLAKKILELKKKRNAIILAHNYQVGEVQEVADFLGDSLDLSRKAARTPAEVVVFCGVHFMAETASILCPDKTVLIPDLEAGCPMADMIDRAGLHRLKERYPDAVVVTYVNTSAEVKAESDICCTSANAIKIVSSLDSRNIIFAPDKYLGNYVASQINSKQMIFWDGYCPVHIKILPEDILRAKREHPQAEVIVHPECRPEVIALADKVLSTTGMCHYARGTPAKEIIVGTESGIIYRLSEENPDKKFYAASQLALCPNMKKITLEKVLWSLEEMRFEVKVKEEIRRQARQAVDKMLAFSRTD
jgi:quinolinate synthase